MDIELRHVTVGELVADYRDHAENGVRAFGGELDVRPAFQREFVYDGKQRDAVIDTLFRGFPLNVMYWADRGEGRSPRYEVIDGQQRTISICQYATDVFSFKDLFSQHAMWFGNQPAERQAEILAYELTVYVCSGGDSEKLDWFRTINIAGEELTDQELRNAVYSGPWVSDAKGWLSRTNCPAIRHAGYLRGSRTRQDYLETAIRWAAVSDGAAGTAADIDAYMGTHQHDADAKQLWEQFETIIRWVKATFTAYRPAMKRVDWGSLWAAHRHDTLDPVALEEQAERLFADEDVTREAGIYAYLLDGDERHLSIRAFSKQTRERVWKKQDRKCAVTGQPLDLADAHADHIKPWSKGGRTTEDNCQVVHRDINLRKGSS